MRYPVLLFLLTFTIAATAQDLTGVWRGNFVQGAGLFSQQYKYEVQIKQQPNKALSGVTYSYLNTIFYGKAACQGIFMDKANNIVLKETKMLELRSTDNSGANIMTCYLSYRKEGAVEYLEGTYSSVSVTDGTIGTNGKVYLKRVKDSDFHIENFLADGKGKNGIKPGAESALLPHSGAKRLPPSAPSRPKPQSADSVRIERQGDAHNDLIPSPPPPVIEKAPVPPILSSRKNKLVKTIVTNSPDIKIQLYDNGEIDNDTVTVYHNNRIVVDKKKLTYDPLTINVTASASDSIHEFVMVAENLGSIPPNSAYMVIFSGGKRYELSVAADLKENAKIVIEYRK